MAEVLRNALSVTVADATQYAVEARTALNAARGSNDLPPVMIAAMELSAEVAENFATFRSQLGSISDALPQFGAIG